MYLLGIDLGSSSVKASLIDSESGFCFASSFYPKIEQKIDSPKPGFAEQDPLVWYDCAKKAVLDTVKKSCINPSEIRAIGIAYQMHGLVCVDKNQQLVRPSIIWCDSRAVPYGKAAFEKIGEEKCLSHLLNSPGNFTASKLAWVKEHEPEIYSRIDKIMLPGDWLAMKLTGEVRTTVSGLSEGILWDYQHEKVADFVLQHFGFDSSLIPEIVPTFGVQGYLTKEAAEEFGLSAGTVISYRAGDQPNNAFSLNVLHPGEIAATAGTSGVVYGVTNKKKSDPLSRVNTFAHVNHDSFRSRLGVLLCINGTGIANAWLKRIFGEISYSEIDTIASKIPVGSDGLFFLPFGNGAERLFGNRELGAHLKGIDFNRHDRGHLARAVIEGVVFSFMYGMEAMQSSGLEIKTIRAGYANMFKSLDFCNTLASVSGTTIELYHTDGSVGAARGAGVGNGSYSSIEDAFYSLKKVRIVRPQSGPFDEAYDDWKKVLNSVLE
ncbi:MAG: carbohydrate kinase [Spirochaetales bacterium]|nr:carbohydrate kinase [Spirochaetales bacterium]